jgi:hypothetical protein
VRVGICEWTTFPASFEELLPGKLAWCAIESMEAL